MGLRQNPMVQSANKIMSFNHTLNLQSAEKIYRKRQKWYLGIYIVLVQSALERWTTKYEK